MAEEEEEEIKQKRRIKMLEQMHNSNAVGSRTSAQKQISIQYKKYFLLCKSCSWHVSFSGPFEKVGMATTDEVTYVRCPICQTGRIIASQSDTNQ